MFIFVLNKGMSITRQKHQPAKHKAHSSHSHSIHFAHVFPAEYSMVSAIHRNEKRSSPNDQIDFDSSTLCCTILVLNFRHALSESSD
jgi:hypothetical protein